MQSYANNAWPFCLDQFNVTFDRNPLTCFNSSLAVNVTARPGQRPCAPTSAAGACGILWVWLSGTAVAIVASCLAIVSSVLAFFWLTYFPISEKTSQLFRVLIVFGQVSPIIFAGIAGVILSVISVQILTVKENKFFPLSLSSQKEKFAYPCFFLKKKKKILDQLLVWI